MDSISHLALGAVIAKAVAGNKYGNKVLLYGAIAASIPDFDVLLSPLFSPVNFLLIHRGLSHSFAIMLMLAPLLTYLSRFIDRDISFKFFKRLTIVLLAWCSHLAVDIFNTYGTAILAPFNNHRLSIDSLPILDITLLVVLLAIALFIVFAKRFAKYYRGLAFIGIATTVLYISASTYIKFSIEQYIKNSTNVTNVYTTPLHITICKWKYVAEYDSCYQIGLVSIFDMKNVEASEYILKNHNLLCEYEGNAQIEKIKFFTKGYYSVTPTQNGWFIYDLRFASMAEKYPEAHVLTFTAERTESGDLDVKPSNLKRHIIK